MSVRRTVLYSVYGLLRSFGYFAMRDRMAPYATVLTFHRVNDKEEQAVSRFIRGCLKSFWKYSGGTIELCPLRAYLRW